MSLKIRLGIGFLVALNLVTAVFLYKCLCENVALKIENFAWKYEVHGLAQYAATMQAISDYKSGRLRILKLTLGGESKFTGEKDGQFEIWSRTYYEDPSGIGKYSGEQFAESYNRKMRYMLKHPEEFDDEKQ